MGGFGATLRRGTALGLLVAGLWLLWSAWPQSLGGRVAYVRVDGWSMNPTLHDGDLVVVSRQSSYRIGDAVAYRIRKDEFGAGALVVHRLIGGDGVHGFVTRGDNRTINDAWHPRTEDVVGRIRFDLPGIGTRFAQASQPKYIGGLVAATTVFVMLLPSSGSDRRSGADRRHAPRADSPPDRRRGQRRKHRRRRVHGIRHALRRRASPNGRVRSDTQNAHSYLSGSVRPVPTQSGTQHSPLEQEAGLQ